MDQSNLLLENVQVFASAMAQSIQDMVGVETVPDTGNVNEGLFSPEKGMIATIHFTGLIQGEYAICVDEKTVASWIGCYEEGMELADLKGMRDDYAGFLKEALNATVGSAILNLSDNFPDLTFLSPVVMYGELDYPSVPSGKMLLKSQAGDAECFFVLNMMGLELGERLQSTLIELQESAKEAALAKKNVEGMLNVFPAGLVIVGRDGMVQPGYSTQTASIVGFDEMVDLSGIHLLSLLGYAEDKDVASAFDPWLDVAFNKWDMLGEKSIIELCPILERKNGRERILHFNWIPRFSDEGKLDSFMVIVDDFTEKRRIEKEMQRLNQQHEQNMELVTQVLNLEPDEISEFLYDSSGLLSEAKKTIRNSGRDRQFIDSLYRTIHTLKGNSGQFQFKSLKQLASNIEKELAELRNAEGIEERNMLESFDFSTIDQRLEEADVYLQRLEELQSRLGAKEESIESKAERHEPAVMVPFVKIQGALDTVKQTLTIAQGLGSPMSLQASLRLAGRSIAQMREVPVSNFGFILESAIERLAHRLKKEAQFTVMGDVQIDVESFRTIHRGLVHLINNALDHGIESPDVRKSKGKLTTGLISLRWQIENSLVHFYLEDDGAGIDLNSVRKTYQERFGLTDSDAAKVTDPELLAALFSSGFTTRNEVTDVSGRGVGLDAVRYLIEGMGGSIQIETSLGKGTRFAFTVPAHKIQPSTLWGEL